MLHKRGIFPLAGDFKWQFFPVACASVCLCMWSFPVAPYCQLIVKHSLQTLSPGFKIALFRRDLLGNRGWVLVMEWSEVAEVERKRRERRGDRVDRTLGLQTREQGRFPGMEVQRCLSFPSMLCCSLFLLSGRPHRACSEEHFH